MDDLISRQAVKELAHNQMREKYCGMALKKQRDFYIKLADSIIDLLPTVQPEPHWIPVTERLPDISKSVLICDIEGDIYLGHRTRYGDYYPDLWNDRIKNVTAWMPLPEPYKGVTE